MTLPEDQVTEDTNTEVETEDDKSFAETAAEMMEQSAKELSGEADPAEAEEAAPTGDDTPAATAGDDTPAAPAGDEDEAADQGSTEAGSDEGLKVPSLNQEERATLDAMPPESRAIAEGFMQRREADMERHFQKRMGEMSSLRTTYEPVAKMFAPHRERLKAAGMSEFGYISKLAEMDQFASRDPLGYMEYVANSLKVDKAQLAQRLGLSSADDDPFSDPQDQQQQQAQQPQPQPQQAPQPASDPVVAQVRQFAAEMVDGVILHPHFDAVSQDMAALATYNPEDDLGQLYEKACLLHGLQNPKRPSPPASQQADDFAAAKQKVARAQAAASVASSSPAAATPPDFSKMSTADMVRHFAETGS